MWFGPVLGAPPSQGKLCVQLLGTFTPETNLTYQSPEDPQIIERWPAKDRPPLINIGGHRLAQTGQTIVFDGTDSQRDEDGVITDIAWNFGDGHTATGMTVTHAYNTPGLYTVTATADDVTTRRWVRVVDDLSVSALDVVSLDELSGSAEQGWRCTFTVAGDATSLVPGTGVILYLFDALDRSWRDLYRRRLRGLARRTAFSALPPPLLAPGEDIAHYTHLGYPSGPCWDAALRYASQIQEASARTGVPPNLLLSAIAVRSCGNPFLVTSTGTQRCPKAYGLAQLAPGCTWYSWTKEQLLDPDQAVMILAQELAARYRQCKRWDDALRALFTNSCSCDEQSTLVTAPCLTAEAVMDAWAEADRAMGGGGEEAFGNVLFIGYVVQDGVTVQPEQHRVQVQCVDALSFLDVLNQRQESFFEGDISGFQGGGTFMVEPPLRVAQAIHHTLVHHTNVPTWHDVVLDWSGPRVAQITAPEGSVANVLRSWAHNEFSRAYGDRYGRIRYGRKAHYRGKAWHDEAIRYAVTVDPTLVMSVEATEHQLATRVGWVKLAGSTSTNNCQVFGEYPCGGPPQPGAGKWVYEQGYIYDDHRVLCAMAAYHYAYLNRRWDLRLTLPWRHDLDVGDLVRFPHKDPSGRYDWRGTGGPVFVVKGITYQYDTVQATLLVQLELEQLTTNVPCACEAPECPEVPGANLPCPSCLGGGGSCSVQVLAEGWRSYAYQKGTGGYLINEVKEGGSVAHSVTVYDWYGTDPDDPSCQVECAGSDCTCLGCDASPHPRESTTPEPAPVPLIDQREVSYPSFPVITRDTQQFGLLSAYYSLRDEVQEASSWEFGRGDGVATGRVLEEEISWCTLLVRGLENSVQRLTIKVRLLAGSPGSVGLLMIKRISGITEDDPFGFVGSQVLGAPTADQEDGGAGAFAAPTVIAEIPAEPVDGWLTYRVDLPGTAEGIHYAVGIGRVVPGPPQHVTLTTPRVAVFEGTYTIPDPYGCDPQILSGGPEDLCCAPFECRMPGIRGPIKTWLSAGGGGLRGLDAYNQADTRQRCDILTRLSGQTLGAHRSVITNGGIEKTCYGTCSVTKRHDIFTRITRDVRAGSLACEVQFAWETIDCVTPRGTGSVGGTGSIGAIGSVPPPRMCPDPSVTGNLGFLCCATPGTYMPSWICYGPYDRSCPSSSFSGNSVFFSGYWGEDYLLTGYPAWNSGGDVISFTAQAFLSLDRCGAGSVSLVLFSALGVQKLAEVILYASFGEGGSERFRVTLDASPVGGPTLDGEGPSSSIISFSWNRTSSSWTISGGGLSTSLTGIAPNRLAGILTLSGGLGASIWCGDESSAGSITGAQIVVYETGGCEGGQIPPGGEPPPDGSGIYIPGVGNFCPVSGACGNWPTAEAIDARIALSEQQNGRRSPLHGMGKEFLRLGAKYGVNPGVVCAILQRESQLASDGSFLPTNANNFGGLTGSGPCGSVFYIDRNWAVFCDPAQGLEGVFARLKEPQYTSTAGTMEAVMAVYSPPFENDWNAMWQTFRAVASQLGITIEPSTPVYSSQPECTGGPGGIPIPSPPPGGSGYGGYWTMFEYVLHAVGARITQGPWGSYSHSRCDCYDFGCPIGTPIYPVFPGTVIVSEPTSGVYTPNVIVVQTQYGNLLYAHLSTRLVNVGQQVGLETLLGYSGTAGTGPHLHLGLEGGTSPYSLDQVLYAAGVAIGAFPWA